MSEVLLLVSLAIVVFVGYNIGGSSTGPAFGPAVGARVLTKKTAAGLMAVFFFLGAFTIGRNVVLTMGEDLLHNQEVVFTIEAGAIVLLFIGVALFVGNYFGVPASTSMTAVGAIAALGIATGELDRAEMGEIVAWWIVSPVVGFWVAGVIGRYFYSTINRLVQLHQSDGPLIEVDRSTAIPRPVRGPNTTTKELVGTTTLVFIGCLMAFSAGTSNIANAIAPLYGAGALEMNSLIAIGSVAVAIGAFTIARRTLDTLGNDITALPLTAAIVVATVASTIVVSLSWLGIPVSFVVIATMSIIGLGWGRATRTVTLSEVRRGEGKASVSVGALTADEPGEQAPEIGEEEPADIPKTSDLFDPSTTGRVIAMQNVVPILSTVGAYVTFTLLFRFVW